MLAKPKPQERPILFNGAMVRAILEGQKTVTRRMVKHQPDVPVTDAIPQRDYPHGPATVDWYWRPQHGHLNGVPSNSWDFKCPYGQPGDRLWVRETFAAYGDKKMAAIHYRADRPHHVGQKGMGYKPSIHMPRWASRIILEITDVRVERLQDISYESARAEGVRNHPDIESGKVEGTILTSKALFECLWCDTYGDDSWDANPWVWVVEFKRLEVANV